MPTQALATCTRIFQRVCCSGSFFLLCFTGTRAVERAPAGSGRRRARNRVDGGGLHVPGGLRTTACGILAALRWVLTRHARAALHEGASSYAVDRRPDVSCLSAGERTHYVFAQPDRSKWNFATRKGPTGLPLSRAGWWQALHQYNVSSGTNAVNSTPASVWPYTCWTEYNGARGAATCTSRSRAGDAKSRAQYLPGRGIGKFFPRIDSPARGTVS